MTEDERLKIKSAVLLAAQAADDKKAMDITILQMSEILVITDYFLIVSGATDRQTRTISGEIQKRLRDVGFRPLRTAGDELGDWILLDYVDFVVHIFTEETRDYYQLERLWKDAPVVDREGRAKVI